jgi:hypothetical protein
MFPNCPTPPLKKYINLMGLPNENRLYLGKSKAEFKKALARDSGAQGVLFDEKTEGRKSLDTVPLMKISEAKMFFQIF